MHTGLQFLFRRTICERRSVLSTRSLVEAAAVAAPTYNFLPLHTNGTAPGPSTNSTSRSISFRL